jgi:hypothetical protein
LHPKQVYKGYWGTTTIDAKQKGDVMITDILNAFVQTNVDEENQVKGECIIMKIRGPLVDMLLKIAPEAYKGYWTYKCKTKVLDMYIKMLKAIYGMLQSSLLYYKKFCKDIESIGFKVNPYNPSVANRIVNGKQHTGCILARQRFEIQSH